MIPYSRPKLSDLCTLLEKHTLHSGTYLYSPYLAVPPPLPGSVPRDRSCVGSISRYSATEIYPDNSDAITLLALLVV